MKEIFERVSIRKYENRPIEDEKIEHILRAAMAAPSAGNQQPWEFYVVTDPEKIKALAATSPYAGCAADAPVVIVPCYRKSGILFPEYAQIDLSIATENLLLAVPSLGLGAVWLGVAPLADRMEKVESVLDMNSNLHAFALVPVGYPAESRKQEDRYEIVRVHY